MSHNHHGQKTEAYTDTSDKKIALVGNPNVGKSVLFGYLTGSYVTVSNYPGTTVEIARGKYTGQNGFGAGPPKTLIDTPGINNLVPSSEDELVTRNIILNERPEHILQVIDTKNLRRGLLITIQLAEMGVPFAVCLNMLDEARSRGITVDTEHLSRLLGVDVIGTVATRKQGLDQVQKILTTPRKSQYGIQYTDHIEQSVRRIRELLPEKKIASRISPRALALMLLAGDDSLFSFLEEYISQDAISDIQDIVAETEAIYPESLHNIITRIRLDEAEKLIQQVMTSESTSDETLTQKFGRWSMHPFWGLPVLLGVLYLMYQFVGVLGAGTLVDFLEIQVFGKYISPWASTAVEWLIPLPLIQDMLVGEYGLLTMALSYSVAIVLPIVGTFFIAFGILEDSGYLPRLAVMVNRIFKAIGLNGKAILPMVLGLGCDTMATLTTRILDSKKERVIVTLLLALGVPCSAQLGVILGMLGGLSFGASVLWAGLVVGILLLVGYLSSKVVKGKGSDFVLELPPIRRPTLSNIFIKTLARIEWYLREAVPLFFIGTFILFVFDKIHLLDVIRNVASPVVSGFLGLPAKATDAFLIGFLRRDFGAAGLFDLAKQGLLDPNQVLVSLVAITLFMPCIANLLMIVKERGVKTAIYMSAFILPFALLVSGGLHWVLVWTGITF
ncbi:MAG: ferrous iron transport protein B [Candidatus Marinimicrobia bacterium]|nr:ferrous iron transport protein B [Candidatus Neomarinimicrobiota bacterium]MCF7828638.1 ferrous iron transport protein B [Candidatus Neomarinimicrobiota bacterium]MCF7880379.1 ferrous iron transport protein B [Candidatus Neomarinimicrobiota bacterium]